MIDVRVRKLKDHVLKNAVAIVGYPSIGLVSSIASNFMSRELKLELVAEIESPDFPPYTVMQNGVPMPQMRIFSGFREEQVEDDGGIDCEDIVIITSEFVPRVEHIRSIATALLDWFEEKDIKTVIALDGIPMFSPDLYEIIGAGSTDNAREIMERYQIEPFNNGMIRGIPGVLLYEGSLRGIDIITILGSARSDIPDPIGAAHLLEPIQRMIPEIKLDMEPLYQEASDLDRRLNQRAVPDNNDTILYG